MQHSSWKKLLVMAICSFIAMYTLMYLMVDTADNIFPNLNQLYMTSAMTAAMVLIELAVMPKMYSTKAILISASTSVLVLIVSIAGVRMQLQVGDQEFLKSMIPHHAAAVLMCKEATLTDPDIIALCDDILTSQQSQIDWMKQRLSTPF